MAKKKNSKGSLKRRLQNLVSTGKDQMRCSGPTYVQNFFCQAKAPLTLGRNASFIWSLSQLNRRAKWIEAGGGECWVFARRILKVRKEEKGGDSHPAGCFSCHSKKSRAKFGAHSGGRGRALTPTRPRKMRFSQSCVMSFQSAFASIHGLHQDGQRNAQKEDALFSQSLYPRPGNKTCSTDLRIFLCFVFL